MPEEQGSRRVFLGCARRAKERAEFISSALAAAKCIPLPWWSSDAFRLGFSLLHNIQDLPRRISGAVFLASPDDKIVSGDPHPGSCGGESLVPRTNVMLELGHFMGVLGPSNVAICLYRECKLPTDLDGVTYIDMGSFEEDPANEAIRKEAEQRIQDWATNLPYAAGLAVSQVVHGYTGRWEVFGKYSKWCDHPLHEGNGDRVELTGYADLWVPADGAGGHGVVHGQLTVDLKTLHSFAEFRLTSLMNNIRCDRDGRLSFETEIFAHKLVYQRTPPDQTLDREFEEEIIGYPRHSWSLQPSAQKSGQLVGSFTLPDHRIAADVEVTKTYS